MKYDVIYDVEPIYKSSYLPILQEMDYWTLARRGGIGQLYDSTIAVYGCTGARGYERCMMYELLIMNYDYVKPKIPIYLSSYLPIL